MLRGWLPPRRNTQRRVIPWRYLLADGIGRLRGATVQHKRLAALFPVMVLVAQRGRTLRRLAGVDAIAVQLGLLGDPRQGA